MAQLLRFLKQILTSARVTAAISQPALPLPEDGKKKNLNLPSIEHIYAAVTAHYISYIHLRLSDVCGFWHTSDLRDTAPAAVYINARWSLEIGFVLYCSLYA